MCSQVINDNYDVVVIGAGNGGLIAAAQLVLKEKKLILFERHNLPGGFASSFTRGRFEFETALHQLCNFGPKTNKGGVRRLFEDDLGLNIDFLEVPEAYRLILTNPSEKLNVEVPFGVENFIDMMEEKVPGSKESIQNYIKLCEEINRAISYLTESQMKTR